MKKFFFSILIIFGVIVLIVLLVVGYIFLRYRNWQKEFEGNIQSEYLIDEESIKEIDFNDKVSIFALSMSDTKFLELDVQEVGSVLFSVLDSYIGGDVNLEKMYITPSDGKWLIYANVRYQDLSLWVSTDINKDDVQSAQIYITEIMIGPFSIGRYINWIDVINKGIGESIVTLNENGLVGRYIENIELLNESVVLKGSRY